MGAWAGGPPTPVRFHDAKCQACAGSAPTCDAASFLPEGKIGRRTVVPNVHALAMLSESEIKRIGPCVVPGERAKASARPQASMECNCAARQSGGSAPPRSTAHSASLRTSDCGTFDPCASSNVSFAPTATARQSIVMECPFDPCARPVVPSELSQFILFILPLVGACARRPAPCGGPQLVLRQREESPR